MTRWAPPKTFGVYADSDESDLVTAHVYPMPTDPIDRARPLWRHASGRLHARIVLARTEMSAASDTFRAFGQDRKAP